MKATASHVTASKKVSQELEIRVEQAVDAFMEEIDQLLAEESFHYAKSLEFSKQLEPLGEAGTKNYLLN